MIYVETLAGTGTMIRCAECGTLIRWPEEARLYANHPREVIQRIEHASHTPLAGSSLYQPPEKREKRGRKSK